MYVHISEFSFFAFTLHPARKQIENQTVAVKKKVKASLHLTFTLIPQDGGKISAHGEKRSEKGNVNTRLHSAFTANRLFSTPYAT